MLAEPVRQVVVLYSNDCTGIISHCSTKSLVPSSHKFTTRNLDLFFFSFFEHLNSLNIGVYLMICQYFGRMERKLSRWKVWFCRLFIVRVEKVCYERKVRGELLGWFFHCTLKWLWSYVPPTSFTLMALLNRVERQCYNETNIPPCYFKNATKNIMILNYVKSDWFYSLQIW